jgi:hypothetical protein
MEQKTTRMLSVHRRHRDLPPLPYPQTPYRPAVELDWLRSTFGEASFKPYPSLARRTESSNSCISPVLVKPKRVFCAASVRLFYSCWIRHHLSVPLFPGQGPPRRPAAAGRRSQGLRGASVTLDVYRTARSASSSAGTLFAVQSRQVASYKSIDYMRQLF